MLHFYTAGESHGQALLAFVSGLPASLPVDAEFINHELQRRQLGYGRGGRQKIEKDRAEIFAGVRHGQRNSIFTMPGTFWNGRRRARPRHAWPLARSPNSCSAHWVRKSPATRC